MTSKEVNIEVLRISQFMTKRKVEYSFSVFNKGGDYDTILDRNFM